VKAWFDSEKYEELEKARDHIEGVLQVSLPEIRDKIFGDAVVFALRIPSDSPFDPSQARGMLALKAADPAMLNRVIDLVHSTQKQNGEIDTVIDRKRGDTSYFVRKFLAGSDRPDEAYVVFPDGTFAISNAESLIQHVIDRKTNKANGPLPASASLTDLPRFQ